MFFHLIPLEELKRHSVTYWRPGRDNCTSDKTWVVLCERQNGYEATIVDLPEDSRRNVDPEDVMDSFLRRRAALQAQGNSNA